MEFSYNQNVKRIKNKDIETALRTIKPQTITEYIKQVALKIMPKDVLVEEFKTAFTDYDYAYTLEGEHIKNFFIIGLNGIDQVWKSLTSPIDGILPYQARPLYENVFDYLEELTDKVDFDDLFRKEIEEINV